MRGYSEKITPRAAGQTPTILGTQAPAAPAETVPEKETRRRASSEPPYKVILHNDPVNTMEHVVEVLRKVIPRLSVKQAQGIMIKAHFEGKAVATKCHKELAELYQESLRAEGLIATIEPD